ncbi:MAG: chitobiase/beta-hexosaminidase C-terminal domain-containing protein [Fibrobacterota bacterium]|nr:MAG: chitobiase/beta-hexosaminidase C-terminal domain-containing protein [Fibrobacterota bacterium]
MNAQISRTAQESAWKMCNKYGSLLRWVAATAILAILGACQDVSIIQEPTVDPPSSNAEVTFVARSALAIPDSVSLVRRADSTKQTAKCVATSCSIFVRLAAPLEKDSIRLDLWKSGIRVGTYQIRAKSDGSGLTATPSQRDDLALRLVEDFAAVEKANPDSVRSLGPDARSRILAYYASRLLQGDPVYAGYPESLPVGIGKDVLTVFLVQVAALSGLGWDRIASIGTGIDSTKIVTIAQDLQKKGAISALEVSALKKRSDAAKVDPAPALVVKNPADAVVPHGITSYLVEASATDPDGIDSMEVNQVRFAASRCSVWVDLTVGPNRILVQALDSKRERTKKEFVVTRRDGVGIPVLTPPGGTYERKQWVRISDTTTGALLEWSVDGGTWNAYTDSMLVAIPETLQVRASLSGRDVAKTTAVYDIRRVEPVELVPGAGQYPVAQTVTYRSSTPGVAYECSFQDGKWQACAGRYTVSTSGTLRVRASRIGMVAAVDSATFKIEGLVSGAPTLSLVSGTYDGPQDIVLGCTVVNCLLESSTDSSVWVPYSAPIRVSQNSRLYARSTVESGAPAVTWADYSIALAPPGFSRASGVAIGPIQVQLLPAIGGATIYYSTDSVRWSPYLSAISVKQNAKIWAWDSIAGFARSRVASASYRIRVPAPLIEPNGALLSGSGKVAISDSLSGATIQYSFDSTLWKDYGGEIVLNSPTRLLARALSPGLDTSEVAKADFRFQLASPAISLPAGTYPSARKVWLDSGANGGMIRFTLDGTDPTATSTAFTDSILISSSGSLRVAAFRTGWDPSLVVSRVYTITGTLPPPTFSVASGAYPTAKRVAISSTASGAEIRFTKDGTEPTAASPLYKDSIDVGATTILKAITLKSGWQTSTVASASYTITGTLPPPTFSLATGTYPSARRVAITSTASGAEIRFTKDGTEPTAASPLYTDSIDVGSTATLKAIALKSGWQTSTVASVSYTITGTLPPPTFSVATGTYTSARRVAITSTASGAEIRFTKDGTEPTSASPLYKDTIDVGSTATLKAIALKSGWQTSTVASVSYTITGTLPPPTFSVATGTYTSARRVAITSTASGAEIRFTKDGTEPTSASPLYKDTIDVGSTATLKAITLKSGWLTSTIASVSYTITGKVAAPRASLAAGAYPDARKVALSSTTPGAEIHYTTDGSAPTSASPLFKDSIVVGSTLTIRAIGIKAGWDSSDVSVYAYTNTSKILGASYQIALDQAAADSATANSLYGFHTFWNKASSTGLAVDSGRLVFRATYASDGTAGYTANVGFMVTMRPDGAAMDLSNLSSISFEYKNSIKISDVLSVSFGSDIYPDAIVAAGTVYENTLAGTAALSAHSSWATATMDVLDFAPPTWWTPSVDFPQLADVLKQVPYIQFAPKTLYTGDGTQNGRACTRCVGPVMTTLTLEVRNIRFIGK